MPDENVGWGAPPAIGHNSGDLPKYEVKYKGQPDTVEPEAWRLMRNATIQHWQTTKTNFDLAQQDERDHRAKVTSILFGDTPKKGTSHYELGEGYKVSLVQQYAYKLGNKDLIDEGSGQKIPIREQIAKLEQEIADLGDAHRVIFESLVTWSPEISGSGYEKLSDSSDPIVIKVRDMISAHLTITPNSPQLKFVEPRP